MPTTPFLAITSSNNTAIADALRSVNGRSTSHTLTSAEALRLLAEGAERALTINGQAPIGAAVVQVSGGHVAAAYKYARTLTKTTIVRSATDWVLVEVERVSASRAVKYWLHPTLFAAAAALPWATRRNCVPLNLSDLCRVRRTVLATLLISLGVSEADVTP
jgi:hypothetical protein